MEVAHTLELATIRSLIMAARSVQAQVMDTAKPDIVQVRVAGDGRMRISATTSMSRMLAASFALHSIVTFLL